MRQILPWISAPIASPSAKDNLPSGGGENRRLSFLILDESATNRYDKKNVLENGKYFYFLLKVPFRNVHIFFISLRYDPLNQLTGRSTNGKP